MSLQKDLEAFKQALNSKDVSAYQKRIIRKSVSGLKAQERMKDLICSLVFKSGIASADQLQKLLPLKKNGLIDIKALKACTYSYPEASGNQDTALKSEIAKLKQEKAKLKAKLEQHPTQADLNKRLKEITQLKQQVSDLQKQGTELKKNNHALKSKHQTAQPSNSSRSPFLSKFKRQASEVLKSRKINHSTNDTNDSHTIDLGHGVNGTVHEGIHEIKISYTIHGKKYMSKGDDVHEPASAVVNRAKQKVAELY